MRVVLPKWLERVLQVLGLAAIASFVALMVITHGLNSGPTTPDPATGRIYAYMEHGRTHYVTALENERFLLVRGVMFIVYPVFFALAIGGTAISALWARARSSRAP